MKKVNITVSICMSNDFVVDVEDSTPEDLYDAFMTQYGLPLGVSSYAQNGKWVIDDLEIFKSNN